MGCCLAASSIGIRSAFAHCASGTARLETSASSAPRRQADPQTCFPGARAIAAHQPDVPLRRVCRDGSSCQRRANLAKAGHRLGIIFCVTAGCVQYSRRFYDEAWRNPATASPLLFPETVFNAPASHLSAILESPCVNYTLVGDPGTFLQALALAAGWLANDRIDSCLVVGAEELDWLTADAYRHFSRGVACGEGAGAVYALSCIEALKDKSGAGTHCHHEPAPVFEWRVQAPSHSRNPR